LIASCQRTYEDEVRSEPNGDNAGLLANMSSHKPAMNVLDPTPAREYLA
jgi:hypothetical protein